MDKKELAAIFLMVGLFFTVVLSAWILPNNSSAAQGAGTYVQGADVQWSHAVIQTPGRHDDPPPHGNHDDPPPHG